MKERIEGARPMMDLMAKKIFSETGQKVSKIEESTIKF